MLLQVEKDQHGRDPGKGALDFHFVRMAVLQVLGEKLDSEPAPSLRASKEELVGRQEVADRITRTRSREPLELNWRVTFEVVDHGFDKALSVDMKDCRADIDNELSKVACAFFNRPFV